MAKRSPTVAAYLTGWLADRKPNLSRQSYASYECSVRLRILPHLGAVPLAALKRPQIRAWLTTLQTERHLSAGTTRVALGVLRACLATAVEDDVIPSNPAARLGRAISRRAVRPVFALSADDVARFLAAAERRYPSLYAFFLLLARTGVRLGEAQALRWPDVDVANRLLHIRHSYSRWRTLGPPKNGEERTVDMSAALTVALDALPRHAAWVFAKAPAGQPWSGRFLLEATKRCAAAAGIADAWRMHPHVFRHTWASLMLSGGAPLQVVQRAMGHRDANLTANLYGKHLPLRALAAVDALDAPPVRAAATTGPRPHWGHRLRAIRATDLGWAQAELAAKVGVDISTVQDWERLGAQPSARTLAALERVLGAAGIPTAGLTAPSPSTAKANVIPLPPRTQAKPAAPKSAVVLIGPALAAARASCGLTRAAFAAEVGVDLATATRWEEDSVISDAEWSGHINDFLVARDLEVHGQGWESFEQKRPERG